MPFEATIGAEDDGRRLDRVLRKALEDLPLSAIHRLLRKGRVRLDGKAASGTDRVRSGSVLRVEADIPVPEARKAPIRVKIPALPEPLWEGAGLLALNKPAGTAVHGPGSLEDAVLDYLSGSFEASLSFRPGPLHRLDQPTSGLIFFSMNLKGAQAFSRALRERRLGKRYLAVLEGLLEREELWEDELVRDRRAGRTEVLGADATAAKALRAGTAVRPLAAGKGLTLALVELGTGRTHQIRAQAAAHGLPLAGDRKYGGSGRPGGFLLHAYEMDFSAAPELCLPKRLSAPLPREFLDAAAAYFGTKTARILDERPPTGELLGAIL